MYEFFSSIWTRSRDTLRLISMKSNPPGGKSRKASRRNSVLNPFASVRESQGSSRDWRAARTTSTPSRQAATSAGIISGGS
jgi:hypothetical protein